MLYIKCTFCGMEVKKPTKFQKKYYKDTGRIFCSKICGRKNANLINGERMRKENPMFCEKTREKMANTLKKIGHKPIIQGGNGKPIPVPQKKLHDFLGKNWILEHAVPTKLRGVGDTDYPTCYKIDIVNPTKKIGIEIDGGSHSSISRQKQDEKKDILLKKLGWKIYRIKNKQIIQNWEETKKLIMSII